MLSNGAAVATYTSANRGQSSVMGVVLIVGVTVMGITGVMLFGATALGDANTRSEIDAAEHAMTQLDSRFSLVALGSSERQGAVVDLREDATVRVDGDRGWMNVSIVNRSDGAENETILNSSLGAVVYENDGTTVAYQGGGVWKKAESGGSVMVSPPEFHYRSRGKVPTLTVPLVVVRGNGTQTEQVTVEADETIPKFPNASDPDLSNPLRGGRVVITVHSDYYQAWGVFFEERTSSDVQYDHPNETVSVELTVPFDEEFSHVLATTTGEIHLNGNSLPERSQEGIGYPSADPLIEDRIDECEADDPACDDTDYYNDDLTDPLDIDTSAGDVTIVVDGSFDPGTVQITGSNNVTVYVREDFEVGDDINVGGNAGAFTVVVHSDGDVTGNGKSKFVGFVYAPESSFTINGGGNGFFKGGIVAESITINGGSLDIEYDPSISGIDLDLEGDVAAITYMHVTVNQVNVSSR